MMSKSLSLNIVWPYRETSEMEGKTIRCHQTTGDALLHGRYSSMGTDTVPQVLCNLIRGDDIRVKYFLLMELHLIRWSVNYNFDLCRNALKLSTLLIPPFWSIQKARLSKKKKKAQLNGSWCYEMSFPIEWYIQILKISSHAHFFNPFFLPLTNW